MNSSPLCIDGCGRAVSKRTRRCDECWSLRPGRKHDCPTCGATIHMRQRQCEKHWMERKAGVVGRARPRISAVLRARVLERDGHTCQECGARGEGVKLVLDHKLPHAAGGATDFDNLVTLCASCNRKKWF